MARPSFYRFASWRALLSARMHLEEPSLRFLSLLRFGLWAAVACAAAAVAGLFFVDPPGPGWVRLAALAVLPALIVLALAWDVCLSRRLAAAHAEALADAAGKTTAARRESEGLQDRLSQCEARHRALLAAQTDVVLTRSADSRLVEANAPFFATFGLDAETALGQPFAPELDPACSPAVSERFARLQELGDCVRCDQRLRTATGWRWFDWQDRFARDGAGKIAEIHSIGRDIDAFKRTEAELQTALTAARGETRARTDFLTAMGREIRTSIGGMIGMARLLLDTGLSGEQRRYTMAMLQSGETLTSLSGDMLDVSKIETGAPVAQERVRLTVLLDDALELFAPRAHAKGIELVGVVAPDVPAAVRIDGRRLNQVLCNLIGVAIKHTETGGVRLDVERLAEVGRLRFRIHDVALRLSAADRRDIARALAAGSLQDIGGFEGLCLGLAVTARLVRAIGGDIGVEPNAEGGNSYWFTLPELADLAASPVALGGLRIAVVAGNPVLRRALHDQIALAGGTTVSLTPDGLRRADLFLIDAGPGPEPRPLLDPVPFAPCLVLVPASAHADLNALRTRGFAGYLLKPVRLASLVERARVCTGIGAQTLAARPQPAAAPSDGVAGPAGI